VVSPAGDDSEQMEGGALDQLRGQALDPKVVKHSWENTFDRL
jgi:hypothetical protein